MSLSLPLQFVFPEQFFFSREVFLACKVFLTPAKNNVVKRERERVCVVEKTVPAASFKCFAFTDAANAKNVLAKIWVSLHVTR